MAGQVEIEVVGLTQLNALFAKIPSATKEQLRVFFARFTLKLRDKVKSNIAWRFHSTGPLYQSVRSELIESPSTITGRVFTSGIPYARILEYGGELPEMDIYPVHARALSFVAGPRTLSTGGGVRSQVFSAHVHRPRTRIPERSYARLALYQMRLAFLAGAEEAVATAIE